MSDQSPGPTRDPLQQLASFGTGGIAVNPLDPASVRRLGDGRRKRRRTAYGAIAAVAVAAAVVPTALLATQDGGTRNPPITGTPSPDPTPTPPPTTAAPTVITFPGESGVEVKSEADLAKLTGTSPEFKAFIGETLQKAVADGSACSDAYHGVNVEKYSSAGFAIGGVNSCGGYVALWTIQDGSWREALGTQDEWRCGDLTRFSVPEGFAGECYGSKAVFGPSTDDGLRLGMSAEQVRAAGGTVVDGPGCRLVFPPGARPDPASTLGYVSLTPGKGVVALYAQKDQVTDRGIAVGDSKDAVTAAYPDGHLQQPQGAWYATIDADSYWRFDFDENDMVVRISLVAQDQDCYE